MARAAGLKVSRYAWLRPNSCRSAGDIFFWIVRLYVATPHFKEERILMSLWEKCPYCKE
jgi:hypothetical protein